MKVGDIEMFECEGYPRTWLTEYGCAARQRLCIKAIKQWRTGFQSSASMLLDSVDVLKCLRCSRCTSELRRSVFGTRKHQERLIAKLGKLCVKCGERPRIQSPYNFSSLDLLCKKCYDDWRAAGEKNVCRICLEPLSELERSPRFKFVCQGCADHVSKRYPVVKNLHSTLLVIQTKLLNEKGEDWFWQE